MWLPYYGIFKFNFRWWLAVSPDSKKVLGLNVCMFFPCLFQFSPGTPHTVQRHPVSGIRIIADSKLTTGVNVNMNSCPITAGIGSTSPRSPALNWMSRSSITCECGPHAQNRVVHSELKFTCWAERQMSVLILHTSPTCVISWIHIQSHVITQNPTHSHTEYFWHKMWNYWMTLLCHS